MSVDTKSSLQIYSQSVEENASLILETNRIADPYYFKVGLRGELYSPSTHCRVRDVIVRDNLVGNLEYQAFESIEEWAGENDEGTIAWISPPDNKFYPTSKIIISELEEKDGEKILFNRAIILDIDAEKCLKLAQDLENYSLNRPLSRSLDQVRSSPLVLNGKVHWTYILEELVEGLSLEEVRNGKDFLAKQKALRESERAYQTVLDRSGWVDMNLVMLEIMESRLLGGYDSSCPVMMGGGFSPFEFFFNSSLLIDSKKYFCKKCPVCNQEINCVVKPGESCPMKNCKAVRKCS